MWKETCQEGCQDASSTGSYPQDTQDGLESVSQIVALLVPTSKDALKDERDGDGILTGQVEEECGVSLGLFTSCALQVYDVGDVVRVETS